MSTNDLGGHHPQATQAAAQCGVAGRSRVIGAAFVLVALFVALRIGAALFAAATIFGTAIASLLIDHYGLLGFPERPLSVARLAGAGCLLLGIALLQSDRA